MRLPWPPYPVLEGVRVGVQFPQPAYLVLEGGGRAGLRKFVWEAWARRPHPRILRVGAAVGNSCIGPDVDR